MFEGIMKFFKKLRKTEAQETNSKDTAKERLHLVLMQDRANVSADFLELMKQEIIDVIKKYIEVDESAIDVRLTNKSNEDGENGAPALYANIPILNIRNDMKKINPQTGKVDKDEKVEEKQEELKESKKEKAEEKQGELKEEKKEKVEEKQEVQNQEEEKEEQEEKQEEVKEEKKEETKEKQEKEKKEKSDKIKQEKKDKQEENSANTNP